MNQIQAPLILTISILLAKESIRPLYPPVRTQLGDYLWDSDRALYSLGALYAYLSDRLRRG
jgi:hypothetical protein